MMMFEFHSAVKTEGAVAVACSDFVRRQMSHITNIIWTTWEACVMTVPRGIHQAPHRKGMAANIAK
jgi:hypothetical protein